MGGGRAAAPVWHRRLAGARRSLRDNIERRVLLEANAAGYVGDTPLLEDAFFDAVDKISDDIEVRVLLTGTLARVNLPESALARVRAAAAKIDDEGEREQVERALRRRRR